VMFGYVLDLLAIIFIFVIKLRGLCELMVAMLLWLFCWLCCCERVCAGYCIGWCYLIGGFGVVFVIGFGARCVGS